MALGLAASVLGMPSTEQGSSPSFAAVYVGNGSAAAPSYSFTAHPTDGLYEVGAGNIGIALGGTLAGSFFASAGGLAVQGVSSGGYVELGSTGGVRLIAQGANQNVTLIPSGTGQMVVTQGVTFAPPTLGTSTGGMFLSEPSGVYGLFLGVEGTGSSWLQGMRVGSAVAYPFRIQPSGGNVLLGTSVDSGALLQIGTNTSTRAGGAIFGTDVGLWRAAAGALVLDHVGGTTPQFILGEGGVEKARFSTGGGVTTLRVSTANSLLIQTNGATTALTIDSAQMVQFNAAASFSANGSVATTMTSIGPTGSHTTIQEWLTIKNASGTTRYIPCY